MKHFILIFIVCTVSLTGLFACSSKAPDLGYKDGVFAACMEKNDDCISSQSPNEEFRIEPFAAQGETDIVMVDLTRSIESIFGSKVIAVEGNYLRAEFRSTIMRTMDDAEFYYDKDAHVIQIHAMSRGDLFDFEGNRERLEELRQIFSQMH
ncbi:DUF1499 domain-containing protein [Pseudodesulfovibrio sediminis]|uniref:DUF1499 domain-containing protein n=1 Tax=Pseudodesulfovibrio sediminis TaxID=2810563 RepID=A0ABN6EPA9_9BACT|nr:DUF1499 domain-containing protein [Pseudodesulfovibrio sediminis]BCS87262.1 hypothetical protein PSDVSF_05040 [Pseudodesulfovibrio sediminis]